MEKQIEYNIAILPTENPVELLSVLMGYGKNGYVFCGWMNESKQISDKDPFLRYGIFYKEVEKN